MAAYEDMIRATSTIEADIRETIQTLKRLGNELSPYR
jgi:hypothetical protein